MGCINHPFAGSGPLWNAAHGQIRPGRQDTTREDGSMANELRGRRIAFMTANEGIEQVELTEPWQAVLDAGGMPELLCPEEGKAQAFNHLDKADIFPVDHAISDADPAHYDGLVLPGGVANPDQLCMVRAAVQFVQAMFESGKPAAVICHGPWTWSRRTWCGTARRHPGRACGRISVTRVGPGWTPRSRSAPPGRMC